LSHLAAEFFLTAGIRRPSATRYKQSRSSVNRMYDSKALRYAEDNRTICTGKCEAEVTNDKNCARGIVLLKLTTDRHEVSRGIFAIAELLVSVTPLQMARFSLSKTKLCKFRELCLAMQIFSLVADFCCRAQPCYSALRHRWRLSVCLSVCPSVTSRYHMKTVLISG